MSLLNSILSSINGSQSVAPPVQSSPSSTARTNPASRNPTPQQAPPKRKADDIAGDPRPKVARTDTNTSRFETNALLVAPPSRSTTSSPAQKGALPPPKAAIPYRGSGPAAKTQTPSRLATTNTTTSSTTRQSVTTSSAPPSSAPVPAKGGGYLAVLQRAKLNAEAAKQAGQIKHKPVEKLTKKDRLRMIEEARAAAKGKPVTNKDAKTGSKSMGRSAEPSVDPKTGVLSKDKRKPVEVAYKGTMRANAPAAPAYRGTMGGSGGASARKSTPKASASSRSGYGAGPRYATYSDEEEDDDEEDELDEYDSGSDMEAGVDEMYDEEESSARIAKREDALALAEENELKRQKLERKRKLEELASKQKKRVY